tara:strand:- start:2850 stop:3260 length:411 start_codon:yes stop_codon:yes gene_type:complete
MAVPSGGAGLVTALYNNGKAFVATWSGTWAGTGEFTNTIIVNLSDLNYTNNMRISKVHVSATAGISAQLEFHDASSNDLIYKHQLGNTGNVVLDFSDIGGLQRERNYAADTGDIVMTTLSAASADAISVVVIGTCA